MALAPQAENLRGIFTPHPSPLIIVVFEEQGGGEVPGTPLSPDTANGYKRLAQRDNKFANSHSGSQSTRKVQ